MPATAATTGAAFPYQRIGEKGMTLDVAQRLRRILQADGYRVIMTRNSDVFIPLGTRVAIANSYRGATFVSVHFNSSPRAGANGVETYYYRSDSAALAASIHRNVVAGAPTENRGIRRRGFFVLRRTAIPVRAGGMWFSHQPDGRQARAKRLLSATAGGTNCAGHSAPARAVQSSADLFPGQGGHGPERRFRASLGGGRTLLEEIEIFEEEAKSARYSSSSKKKKSSDDSPARKRPGKRNRRIDWTRRS